jgi:sialic acid synthase SpsE/protoporphyrinogen oxidase
MNKNIVLIGAGPTALTTALFLSKKKFNVELFDQNKIVGGLAGSEVVDGMHIDYGPHIFHSNQKQITDFFRNNFSDLLYEMDFYSKNYKDGVLYDYPITLDSIEKFPEETKIKVKREIAELKAENLKRARNFKEAVVELVGPTLQSIFFQDYTEKLWGIPPDQMSANWAPKRIELRKKGRAFWAGQYSAIGKFGAGKIWERCAEDIEKNNGKINLNKKLISCDSKDNKITKLYFKDGTDYDVSDKIVISTIPLNTICSILDIPCKLIFNSVRLVYLVLSKKFCLPEDVQSIYFAHSDYAFHRVTEQKRFYEHSYPDDKTILTFEVSYTKNKHYGEMTDEQITKIVFDQLVAIGMAKKDDLIKGFSRKLPNVNPVMYLGYEKELAIINSKVNKYENLLLAGGAAEFIYGDVQSMIARGMDMAELLSSNHYEINKNLKVGSYFKFNKEVEIYNNKVGHDHPSLIIAEIGINHCGKFDIAKELIQNAKDCGCEIAKIQTYEAGSRVSDKSFSAKYADRTLGMEESQNEMFDRYSLTYDEQKKLFEFADEIGISLMSTPFDEGSVDHLIELGVKAFKIASFDIVNIPFLRYVASKQLPIILSTGMSTMSEVEDAIEAIAKERNPNLVILHCVSAYPTSYSDVNLSVIETLRESFKIPVGFSDHSIGLLSSTVALSLKADIIEKHFTLDTYMEGPDHILSSNYDEMKKLVDIRNDVYISLGNGIKQPAPVEIQQINKQRKSLFAKTDIKKGEILTLENITIKGPGIGLMPKFLPIILGKKATTDVPYDTAITFDEITTS